MVPELLAPAGTPEALDAAIASGADAVYLGLKTFNARMRSANFAYAQFEAALRSLHRMGRKVYVTVNTVFEQRESDRVYQLLNYLDGAGPDGIIVQDFGILMMARECSRLRVHASTQMNIASARGANALSRYGVSRAVLARELSLDEIRGIREGTNLELEMFVHGALCVSESGLCLFSSYLGGKSANRGMCTQACRRLYHTENEGKAALSEGYFFSPCDLSLIDHLQELAEAGVRAFKIEGRMKSAEYVGTVVSAYRLVLDSLGGGEAEKRRALEDARRILRNDFARPKTAFMLNAGTSAGAWLRPDQTGGTGISLGTILSVKNSGGVPLALVKSGGALAVGDSIRLHKADDTHRQTHKLTFADPSGSSYYISIPEGFDTGDSVYLIQTRAMTKRYPVLIRGDLAVFRRRPGREKAPRLPEPEGVRFREGSRVLPEGVYVSAASAEDLYVIQSVRPEAAILPLNKKTSARLLDEEKPLPFKPSRLLLSLDPYFPQDKEPFYAEILPALTERGYKTFILNNPGHFSFFNKQDTTLVAGPWLYTFNEWAAAFTLDMGAAFVVSPLENNRQNLEKTWPRSRRARVFVPLFAWPPLFRIRDDLDKCYPFKTFGDNRGENFFLAGSGRDRESVIVPEQPFSITDKKQFLETAGFRRFLLDFSGGVFSGSFPLKKHIYKDVMKAVREGTPLSGTVRFNWKNGFFQEKEQND